MNGCPSVPTHSNLTICTSVRIIKLHVRLSIPESEIYSGTFSGLTETISGGRVGTTTEKGGEGRVIYIKKRSRG